MGAPQQGVLPDLQRRRPERMLKTLAITSDSPVLTRYGPGILFRLKAQGSRPTGEKALAVRVTMCRCVQRDLQPAPLGADIAQ